MGWSRKVVALSTCLAAGAAVLARRAAAEELLVTAGPAASQPADEQARPTQPQTTETSAMDQHLSGDWGGLRQKFADQGVTFGFTFTADVTKNLRGGIDTAGSAWRILFDAAVTLDTTPLLHFDGGTAFADFQVAQGPNASDKLIGDVQGIDGLDGVPGMPHQDRVQLSQLWYQQVTPNNFLRVKIGKVDANTEFDHVNAAQEFLHQSAGSSATLLTLPTYPDPSIGLNVFVQPRDDIQLGVGVYDGSLGSGVRTGGLGPDTLFDNRGDLFVIAEADKSWTLGADELAGRAGIGGWYSSNDFHRLDGATESGTGGPYAFLEQALWRADPHNDQDVRGVTAFLMYGYADPAISPYDHNLGAGLAWTGPIPGRPDDILGVALQGVHFGHDFHAPDPTEVSYELFYRVRLTPWASLKPDLQYITTPAGQHPDALAATVRVQIDF